MKRVEGTFRFRHDFPFLVINVQWPFSYKRRTIRWIIRVRQVIRLNVKMERLLFWMNNPSDFMNLFIGQLLRILEMDFPC